VFDKPKMTLFVVCCVIAVALGVAAGSTLAWLLLRYGATEHTYAIYAIICLAGFGAVFLMQKIHPDDFRFSGLYWLAFLMTQLVITARYKRSS
jgi:hypothetical protein